MQHRKVRKLRSCHLRYAITIVFQSSAQRGTNRGTAMATGL